MGFFFVRSIATLYLAFPFFPPSLDTVACLFFGDAGLRSAEDCASNFGTLCAKNDMGHYMAWVNSKLNPSSEQLHGTPGVTTSLIHDLGSVNPPCVPVKNRESCPW